MCACGRTNTRICLGIKGVHGEFINGLIEVSSSLVVLSLGFKTKIALLSLWVQVEVEGLIGIVGSAN